MSSGISPTAARTRKMLQERRQSCTCVGAAADVQRRASGGAFPSLKHLHALKQPQLCICASLIKMTSLMVNMNSNAASCLQMFEEG